MHEVTQTEVACLDLDISQIRLTGFQLEGQTIFVGFAPGAKLWLGGEPATRIPAGEMILGAIDNLTAMSDLLEFWHMNQMHLRLTIETGKWALLSDSRLKATAPLCSVLY